MNRDDLYGFLVCVLVFLALGFAGWYENYVPAPEIDMDRVYTAQGQRP